ncbi:MAG: maltose ABC transporter permease MalG [Thermotoga sp.]|nr:MAG: maltose ABC transporter permease MalG [Thermotoga sp.]
MHNRSRILKRTVQYVVIFAAIAFALFPVVWIISASINPGGTLYGQRLIPKNPTLDHYKVLFTDKRYPFVLWLWNSIKVSVTASLITVFLCALASYAFSRFHFRGRRTGLLTLLLIQMFPVMLAFVALYLLLLWIGKYLPFMGLNTHPGLILVYLGGALGFNTWLMKGYFDTIPHELEEAALIDGATRFQTFMKIIIPLARPILTVIFILTFIGDYSEYLLASIILTGTKKYTLAVGLNLFITSDYARHWGTFAAAAIIGSLPVLFLFFSLQKQIISGLTGGGVKG